MSTTSTPTARGAAQRAASPVAQPIVRATLVLAGVAILGAMVLSYSAQAALAARCGLGAILAWLYPVVVDVPLVAATLAATAMHSYPWRSRAMPMATLLGYVGVSVWLNAEHAAYMDESVPQWLRVVILSIPALTLAVVVGSPWWCLVGRSRAPPGRCVPLRPRLPLPLPPPRLSPPVPWWRRCRSLCGPTSRPRSAGRSAFTRTLTVRNGNGSPPTVTPGGPLSA